MALRNKIYSEARPSYSIRKESHRIERKRKNVHSVCTSVPCDHVADWRFESESWPENESEGEREEGGRSLSYR